MLGHFLTPIAEAEEITFHQLLGRHRLAPTLLFRFANGHAYPFVEGEVCTVSTLAEAHVQRGVAAELARWHTVLPTGPGGGTASAMLRQEHNVWATARRWLDAAPGGPKGKEALRRDFDYLVQRVLESSGQAPQGLVLGHGDLLCANVILPRAATEDRTDGRAEVRFIDYEYVVAFAFNFLSIHPSPTFPLTRLGRNPGMRVTAQGHSTWPITFPSGPASTVTTADSQPDQYGASSFASTLRPATNYVVEPQQLHQMTSWNDWRQRWTSTAGSRACIGASAP